MLTTSLTGQRPNPVLSAKDMHANPGAPSNSGTATTPQTARSRIASAVAVQGGPYTVGPVNPGPALAGIFVVIALMFALRLVTDGAHEVQKHDKTRFKEVDITIWNVLIIGLLAAPGIVLWKTLAAKYLHPQNPIRVIYSAA